MHLSTCKDFKNSIVEKLFLLFCNSSLLIISAYSNLCKPWSQITNTLLSTIKSYARTASNTVSDVLVRRSFVIIFVRLTIFEISVPVSDMWQPKHAFDIHLRYLAVITVKIHITQYRIALWIPLGSCFSNEVVISLWCIHLTEYYCRLHHLFPTPK